MGKANASNKEKKRKLTQLNVLYKKLKKTMEPEILKTLENKIAQIKSTLK